jgi:hypothetical protein
MPEGGECVAVTTIEEEQEKTIDKEAISIRFSLFFDGTLNNRTNIEEREKYETGDSSVSYKEEGDGGANSYDNGRTNIALMEPHAPNKMEKKCETGCDYVFKVYIEGQGTFNKEGDSMLGYSMGAGASGVAGRARQGINTALGMIEDFLADYPPKKYSIEKVDVDVFGFSRGAATARHSISLILLERIMVSPQGDVMVTNVPVHDRLRGFGYSEITEKNIEVTFAGIYDTVVSVNASQYSWWSDNRLDQRAVAAAKKCVHLAAAEEHRIDFPLHTIKSAIDKGTGEEYYLPGVHSDIGGSYNLANKQVTNTTVATTIKVTIAAGSYKKMVAERDKLIEEEIFAEDQLEVDVTESIIITRTRGPNGGKKTVPKEAKLIELRVIHGDELMRVSSEVNRVINKGLVTDLKKDRDRLVEQGWYKYYPNNPKYNEIEIQVTHYDSLFRAYGRLVVNRKNIKSAYSNIPLKIMAKFTRENGIELDQELEDKANKILENESDLLALEEKIKSYVASVGAKSKADDWLEDLSIMEIRHDHLHMSSKVKTGYSPRIRKNKRVRYYYEG